MKSLGGPFARLCREIRPVDLDEGSRGGFSKAPKALALTTPVMPLTGVMEVITTGVQCSVIRSDNRSEASDQAAEQQLVDSGHERRLCGP